MAKKKPRQSAGLRRQRAGAAYAALHAAVKADGNNAPTLLINALSDVVTFLAREGYEPWTPGAAHVRKIRPKGAPSCPDPSASPSSSSGSPSPGSPASSAGSGEKNPSRPYPSHTPPSGYRRPPKSP